MDPLKEKEKEAREQKQTGKQKNNLNPKVFYLVDER